MRLSNILLVSGLGRLASGHTIFCQLEAGGKTNGSYISSKSMGRLQLIAIIAAVGYGIRVPSYDGVG